MSEDRPEKITKKTQSIIEVIADRWSPRAFADRDVEPEKLVTVLEAARWAPSSYNEQPWRFIVARREDKESFSRMLSVLVPGNAEWAESAPVLVLTVASLKFKRNDRPNLHAWHDVGLASQNMAIQATHEGLAVHFMAGFDAEKAVASLEIPEGYTPVAAVAIGYHLESGTVKIGERARKNLSEIVFSGRFGSAADFLV